MSAGIYVLRHSLFVAVDNIEPNRRYALVLKLLVVFVSVAAIAGRLVPKSPPDAISGLSSITRPIDVLGDAQCRDVI